MLIHENNYTDKPRFHELAAKLVGRLEKTTQGPALSISEVEQVTDFQPERTIQTKPYFRKVVRALVLSKKIHYVFISYRQLESVEHIESMELPEMMGYFIEKFFAESSEPVPA